MENSVFLEIFSLSDVPSLTFKFLVSILEVLVSIWHRMINLIQLFQKLRIEITLACQAAKMMFTQKNMIAV